MIISGDEVLGILRLKSVDALHGLCDCGALRRIGIAGFDDHEVHDLRRRWDEIGRESSRRSTKHIGGVINERRGVREADGTTWMIEPMAIRAATAKDRTVVGTLATENPVLVYDIRNAVLIYEVLLAQGGTWQRDHVVLLANHRRDSLDAILGSVTNIRRDGDRVIGVLHIATGPEMSQEERAWRLIEGGHLRDISVGYVVHEATDIQPGKSAVVAGRRFTATDKTLRVSSDWTLKEASLTPIGADPAAKIGSAA